MRKCHCTNQEHIVLCQTSYDNARDWRQRKWENRQQLDVIWHKELALGVRVRFSVQVVHSLQGTPLILCSPTTKTINHNYLWWHVTSNNTHTHTHTHKHTHWSQSPDSQPTSNSIDLVKYHKMDKWLGFNGTFSSNRLYRASEKYVLLKKVKWLRKLTMLRVGNTYNKQLQ